MNEDDLDRNKLLGRTDDGAAKEKRKKIIIGTVVGLIVITVIIILITTLGGGGGGDDPGNNPVPEGYNPYNVDEDTIEMTNNEAKGVITAGDDVKATRVVKKLTSLMSAAGAVSESPVGAAVDAIDPSSIPTGDNNQIIKKIRYHF